MLLPITAERSLTLLEREKHKPALWLAGTRSACAVMVCSDVREADDVGRHLSQLNTGCLVSYLKAEDLVRNAPTGTVALVILATDDSPEVLRQTLQWLRRRWPRCPVTVVGAAGCGDYEMAAREAGATFLTRPVHRDQWLAVLSHALRVACPQLQRADDGQAVAEGHVATD